MAEWSHLPNAVHIDRILKDRDTRPDVWGAARRAARGAVASLVVWDAAWSATWGAVRDAARDAAWGAAWDAARGATQDATWDATWGAARGAVASLVAWDDCAFMLDLTPDAVQMLIETGDETTRHPALLLLGAVIALNT
jgi:hypothetical protein